MRVHRVAHPGLGNSSYVVELGDGGALVIDPARDPAPYLELSDRLGLRLRAVAETHLHADFISGSAELLATGAQLLAARGAALELPHRALEHGDTLELGGLTLEVRGTAGHSPEHLSYLLRDGARPVALFSGGALLAGGVARTDLVAPERTEELARAAWRSLRERLLPLPDELPVHPTHGGGSFCSVGEGGQAQTTIGRERAANPLLAAADEDDFVRRLLDGYGSFPPYFLRLRELNRRGPRVLGQAPPLAPLAPDAVERLLADGALLVDARPIARFAEGHVPAALSVELREQFGVWLGWLAPPDVPLVFVTQEGQDERDLVWQALTVGLEQLAGRLEGGVEAWAASGRPLAATTLAAAGGDDGPPPGAVVLDVRQRAEWEDEHVPGGTHVELGALAERVGELPDAPLYVHCGHGQRAMSAASVLARQGRHDVTVATVGPDRIAAAAPGR